MCVRTSVARATVVRRRSRRTIIEPRAPEDNTHFTEGVGKKARAQRRCALMTFAMPPVISSLLALSVSRDRTCMGFTHGKLA